MLECAAIGVADAQRGQIVHVDVVLRPGWTAGPELAGELRAHARAATAPYKQPRSMRFVAELPHTATGKLRRAEVRRAVSEGGGQRIRW